jgi:hypothetical protein
MTWENPDLFLPTDAALTFGSTQVARYRCRAGDGRSAESVDLEARLQARAGDGLLAYDEVMPISDYSHGTTIELDITIDLPLGADPDDQDRLAGHAWQLVVSVDGDPHQAVGFDVVVDETSRLLLAPPPHELP